MIKINNITIETKHSKECILKDISIDIKKGEFISIIGPNGSGKTTLLKAIKGSLKIKKGKIIIDGKDITNMPESKRSAFIAKIEQDPKNGTIESMTIEENMQIGFLRGIKKNLAFYKSKQKKEQFIKKLSIISKDISNNMDKKVCDLSGGQRQALGILMQMTTDFDIALLDEVTSALDIKTATKVMDFMVDMIREKQKTTIMVTHNINEAIKYSDKILLLSNGKLTDVKTIIKKNQITKSDLFDLISNTV